MPISDLCINQSNINGLLLGFFLVGQFWNRCQKPCESSPLYWIWFHHLFPHGHAKGTHSAGSLLWCLQKCCVGIVSVYNCVMFFLLFTKFQPNTAEVDRNNLCVAAYSGKTPRVLWVILYGSTFMLTFWIIFSLPVEDLLSLSDENWTVFISEICLSLGEQNPIVHASSSRTRPAGGRSRLHLLCYLCSVVQHEVVAKRLINSKLVGKCQLLRIRSGEKWCHLSFHMSVPVNVNPSYL